MSAHTFSRKGSGEAVELVSKEVIGCGMTARHRRNSIRPKATEPLFLQPDQGAQAELDAIEKLLNQRHFGEAMRRLEGVQPIDTAFRAQHLARLTTQRMRACRRVADTYGMLGKLEEARRWYGEALQVRADGEGVAGEVVELADGLQRRLQEKRLKLVATLVDVVQKGVYERYCETKRDIKASSLVALKEFRASVDPDWLVPLEQLRWWLESGKDGVLPAQPPWVDPTPENWGLDLQEELLARPGALLEIAGSTRPRLADVSPRVYRSPAKIRASVAMPIIAERLRIHEGLWALGKHVDASGLKQGPVPLYRYEYLREQVLAVLDRVGRLEEKLLFLQDSVDDFAEIVHHIEAPLAEKQEELAALQEQIDAALAAIGDLGQAHHELSRITSDLQAAQDDCDYEWWEVLLAAALFFGIITLGVVLGGLAGAGIGFLIGGPAGAAAFGEIGMFVGFAAGAIGAFAAIDALDVWVGRELTCDNVDAAHSAFGAALSQVQQALSVGQDELQVALLRRDVLEAEIAALSSQLQAVYEDNAQRHLDASTIQTILGIYEETRSSAIRQATVLAQRMEAAYRFEHGDAWRIATDSAPRFIASAYEEPAGKGYGARERLLKDLDSLHFAHLTGSRRKQMQLTLPISLTKHYPLTMLGLKATGKSAFTLDFERFDRLYPGTSQHRLKEVRVEVFCDGVAAPIRGYLSCYGPSQIRFPDPGNKFPVDGRRILREPDDDIAKLCYKRTWQIGPRETMAFPDLESPRSADRIVARQRRERNFFENLGLGSTWLVELLPDQNVDMIHLTDIVVTFQFEAAYDENLRQIVESKRFDDLDEVAVFSARRLMERQQREFDAQAIEFDLRETSFPYAYREKFITNLAVFVKRRSEHFLEGAARIKMQLDDEQAIQANTDSQGRIATGKVRNSGGDATVLGAAYHSKSPVGRWRLGLTDLPPGASMGDIEDVLFLVRYEYDAVA